MSKQKALCLIAIFCLALLIPSCGERGHSRAKDEDADERPATGASAKLPAAMPAFGKPVVYNFDADAAGKPPAHFTFARTGQGTEGTWVVKEDPTAPSKPNVLAQVSTDTTDYRFPLAVLQEGSFQDVAVSVKFKAVAGKVDQAGGIVFRYQDLNNYYVARANALEDNYRLYHVVTGRRRQFAGANFRVTSNQWHTLRVEVIGSQIKCYYDGALKITAADETFKGPGKVGLWTKADSVTHFDDFEVSTP
jgi:glycosyl hydrolase family 59 (putative galactocerebrosidase)